MAFSLLEPPPIAPSTSSTIKQVGLKKLFSSSFFIYPLAKEFIDSESFILPRIFSPVLSSEAFISRALYPQCFANTLAKVDLPEPGGP